MEYVYIVEHNWHGDNGEGRKTCGVFKTYKSAEICMLRALDKTVRDGQTSDKLHWIDCGYIVIRVDGGWDAFTITTRDLMD